MKYTEEHEWLDLGDDGIVTVGITAHAAEQLGDVVFVELPEVGTEVSRDDEVVVIESVKAASDILAPLDGEIVEVNEAIADEPGKVNDDPEGEAWFFRMKIEDVSALDEYMDAAGYRNFIGGSAPAPSGLPRSV
jgi:glycine cleavage system H protein